MARLHRGIGSAEIFLLREAHPSEAAVENRQSGPDLAVAGDFGRAAILSFFSAPLRSSAPFGCGFAAPGFVGRRRDRPAGSLSGDRCQHPPALPFGLPAAGYLAPLGSLRSSLRL